ncbi:MAG TPA: hypothetical protein VJ550_14790 [Geomonas sp.]|nr:hypothetical protein [Geomonas sp.]
MPPLLHRLRTFFCAPAGSRMGLRLVLSALIAFSAGAAVFAFLLQAPLRTTAPVEMMGCLAFYDDLNITNRLFAVTVFLVGTFLVFWLCLKSSLLQRVAAGSACTALAGYWREVAGAGRRSLDQLVLRLLFLGQADQALQAERRRTAPWLAVGLLFAVAAPEAVYGVLRVALAALLPDQQAVHSIRVAKAAMCVVSWFLPLLLAYLWVRVPRRLPPVVIALQALLLCFFAKLLPNHILQGEKLVQPLPLARVALAAGLLAAAGVAEVIWRRRRPLGEGVFSRLALFALLVGLAEGNGFTPSIWPNTYEVGSRIPEFWMSWKGDLTLFKDVYITYGLHDYLSYALGWLAYGEATAMAALAGADLFSAILKGVVFCLALGEMPLALAVVFAWLVPTGQEAVVFIYAVILLRPSLVRSSARWIVVWSLISAFFPFGRIPQGTMCVLASFPAALMQAVNLFREDRKRFVQVLLFLAVLGAAVVGWPFGGYFWGLIRIFTETAAVNAPWAASGGLWWSSSLLGLVAGYSFFLVPLLAFAVGHAMTGTPVAQNRSAYLAAGLFLFVAVYLYVGIGYGFSRMDCCIASRQYVMAAGLVAVLFAALMIYCPPGAGRRGLGLLLLTVLFTRQFLEPGGFPSAKKFYYPGKALYHNVYFSRVPDANELTRNSSEHLGTGLYPAGYEREARAVREAMDSILAPGETFLDLTVDGLHYFSSGRKLLTEYPVYYVYPGDKPQFRALDVLRRNHVRVSLLDNSWVIDHSPVSIRAFYLYRYALQNGLPLEISPKKTVLMPAEYFRRLNLPVPDEAATMRLLDRQFADNDLGHLPEVWGRGVAKFAKKLRLCRDFSRPQPGNQSECRLPLGPPLKGGDGGVLVVDLATGGGREVPCELFWRNGKLGEVSSLRFTARSGPQIIPADSSHRWLLASSISEVGIRSLDGRPLSISSARLYAR